MERTIRVNGSGKATLKSNCVVLSLTFEEKEKKNADAVANVPKKVDLLNSTLKGCGLKPDCTKTVRYNVRSGFSLKTDSKSQTKRVFDGFIYEHEMTVEFDFDKGLLYKVLTSISYNLSNPELDVSFAVKDNGTAYEEVLRDAVKDARIKAEILCEASGARLGKDCKSRL